MHSMFSLIKQKPRQATLFAFGFNMVFILLLWLFLPSDAKFIGFFYLGLLGIVTLTWLLQLRYGLARMAGILVLVQIMFLILTGFWFLVALFPQPMANLQPFLIILTSFLSVHLTNKFNTMDFKRKLVLGDPSRDVHIYEEVYHEKRFFKRIQRHPEHIKTVGWTSRPIEGAFRILAIFAIFILIILFLMLDLTKLTPMILALLLGAFAGCFALFLLGIKIGLVVSSVVWGLALIDIVAFGYLVEIYPTFPLMTVVGGLVLLAFEVKLLMEGVNLWLNPYRVDLNFLLRSHVIHGVDLSIRHYLPLADCQDCLIWTLDYPNQDEEEMQVRFSDLTPELNRFALANNGLYVGGDYCTYPKRFRAHFYAQNGITFRKKFERFLLEFNFELGRMESIHDPDWQIYFDQLNPSLIEESHLRNAGAYREMMEENIDLSIPHLQHYILAFETHEQAQACLDHLSSRPNIQATLEGPATESQILQFGADHTYIVILAIVDRITLDKLNQTTEYAIEVAARFGGSFWYFERRNPPIPKPAEREATSAEIDLKDPN